MLRSFNSTAILLLLLVLTAGGPATVSAFAGVGVGSPCPSAAATASSSLTNVRASTSRLNLFKGKDYDKVVQNLMTQKGLTRKQAEKEYDSYRQNPTNYAMEKGEAYYRSLGYKSFMDGVIGEAEKEGRGDEVRKRIADYKKKSQLKAAGFMAVALSFFCYLQLTNPL